MRFKILVFILVLPVLVFAEEFYTLDELLLHALENNTTLKQSNLDLDIARARLGAARVNYLPDLSAGLNRTHSYDNIHFDGERIQNFAQFSVIKNIALNNEAYFSNRNARHDLSSAEIMNEIQRQNIIYDVIQNYISVLENQMRIALLEENIAIQESIVFESNQLFRQQRITQFEVQQSEINLLNARISALNARNNLTVSRNLLFDLINKPDTGLALAEVDLFAEVDLDDFAREINFDQILRVRADNIASQRHRTSITRTRLNFFPQMNLQYNYRRRVFSEDLEFNHGMTDHSIGLNLSYSLNDLFRNRFTYRQVQSLDEHNQLGTGQLLRNIALRHNQFVEELNFLHELIELQELRAQQTAQNLAMAQQRFRLGLVTQLDIDKAIFENHDSQIGLASSRYQLMMKKLQIDYLLSTGLRGF